MVKIGIGHWTATSGNVIVVNYDCFFQLEAVDNFVISDREAADFVQVKTWPGFGLRYTRLESYVSKTEI